jgi:ABC-2 type transport system permease protein
MNALSLYGRYIVTSLRAQAQYPTATLMLTAGHAAATSIEILGVFALFNRFGSVGGWSFGEAALFYALVNIMFSLADLLSRGFEVFGADFVRTGAFDRVLLRPRAAALQLAGYEVRLSRLGRLIQASIVLVLATNLVPIVWDAQAITIAVWAVAGGIALFMGIMVLQATLAFWTIDSLEIMNVLSDPEAARSAGRTGLVPAACTGRRFRVPCPVVRRLARRRGALCLHGELRRTDPWNTSRLEKPASR